MQTAATDFPHAPIPDLLPPSGAERGHHLSHRHQHRLSVAPMMDWTDRHCRYFLRLISRRVLLYTEMVTTGAILQGPRERLLAYSPDEHPLVLQLGGDEPEALATCAVIAEELGYAELNLNVGCPSDRVQNGHFGACLMRTPERVAACVDAMRARVKIPVSVKHRIGVDELDAYEHMAHFVSTVASSGCTNFIVHARKAWLSGLSPKENREIPPLRYDDVYRLKREFPHLLIEINGGIETLEQAQAHLNHVDGVMIGRAAYHNPYLLAQADALFFGDPTPPPSRAEVVAQLLPYISALLEAGEPLHRVTRHMLGLYHGQVGARAFKRILSENPGRKAAGLELLTRAMQAVADAVVEAESLAQLRNPRPGPAEHSTMAESQR